MLKEVYAPSLKRNVKFGMRMGRARGPSIKLRNYLRASLVVPATADYTQGTPSLLSALTNVDENDVLGDCVIAWLFHQLAIWTGQATGTAFQPTIDQINALYGAIGGYIVGQPNTDNGCDPNTAANWIVPSMLTQPIGLNPTELQQAIYLLAANDFEQVDGLLELRGVRAVDADPTDRLEPHGA